MLLSIDTTDSIFVLLDAQELIDIREMNNNNELGPRAEKALRLKFPGRESFRNGKELKEAVKIVTLNGRPSVNLSTTKDDVYKKYGYPINRWDVSKVKDFTSIFEWESFNENIGDWDVSSGIKFDRMFHYATSFNQDISRWNVSNGTSFRDMFNGATYFNQDISRWDV